VNNQFADRNKLEHRQWDKDWFNNFLSDWKILLIKSYWCEYQQQMIVIWPDYYEKE
jgi:hypothetical protein